MITGREGGGGGGAKTIFSSLLLRSTDYKSRNSCADLVVQWESKLQGVVRSKYGSIPIEDVLVQWRLPGHAVGSVHTNAKGEFEVRIISNKISDPVATVQLEFSKVKKKKKKKKRYNSNAL